MHWLYLLLALGALWLALTTPYGWLLFLALLATIPSLFTQGTSQALPFGTSSLLIAVSVILETKRQLDDLLVSRNYDKIS